jgi:hypothetical protein
MTDFKSPLDEEVAKHGRRYGFLTYFVKEALNMGAIKHDAGPGIRHAADGLLPRYDANCVRCELEKALEHANREGWEGLEWNGGRIS